MTTRLPDIEEPIDTLDKRLEEIVIAIAYSDNARFHPESYAQAIKDLFSQSRGCIDCKKLRCEECERLWQT